MTSDDSRSTGRPPKPRPGREAPRLLALQALLWILVAQVVLALMPFRYVAAFLSRGARARRPVPDPVADRQARLIGQVVRSVSRRLPWKPRCLVKSIAATGLLRRRGMESTLYLGVARQENGGLRAHAWVRSVGVDVVGGCRRDEFAVVGTFESRVSVAPRVPATRDE